MKFKLFVVLAFLASFTLVQSANVKLQLDQIPKLSDALTVAKSPFEPVTLAERSTSEPALDLELVGEDTATSVHRQTTRTVDERERDADETPSSSSVDGDSATSKHTQKPVDAESITTSTASSEPEVTTNELELDQDTTTSTPLVPVRVVESSSRDTTEAPVTPAQEVTSNEETSSTGNSETDTTTTEAVIPTKPIVSTTTTTTPTTTTTTTTTMTTTTTTTPTPTTTTTTTTQAPTETTTQKASTSVSSTTLSESERVEDVSTTEIDTSDTQNPVREQPDNETIPSSTATVTSTSVTTTQPETSATSVATANGIDGLNTNSFSTSPSTSSSTSTESTLVASTANSESSLRDNKTETDTENKVASCNHLPTYESEEVQKVFREEITYKNGTIKGKFTYINFDQRYRLVHYTRLPYGPVKIDLVEELGRPENSSNQTKSTSLNDIPNAVLQLRNILPNSLFGFPFQGTNTGSRNGIKPTEHNEDTADRSNTYFYSTDTLETPNLLSSNVPISVLPDQRRLNKPIGSLLSGQVYSDSLDQQFAQQKVELDIQKLNLQGKTSGEVMDNLFGMPSQQQFHPPLPSPQTFNLPNQKQPGLIYSYMPEPHHYFYSPLTFHPFNQPAYFTSHSIPNQSTSYALKVRHEAPIAPQPHHTHQPHSHEHYIAPFMFTQPDSKGEQPQETLKLKLRVKTSKSLNVANLETNSGKSAQLRASSSGSHSALLNSPSNRLYHLNHPQGHRSGKQSQELKQTVNTSPVVYHILRSPAGQMYSLPQYNLAHSMAYDQDKA